MAILAGGIIALAWWVSRPPEAPETPVVPEAVIIPIPLSGGPEMPNAEISGLAWFGDQLVLLPQYPERFDNTVFVVSRAQILSAVDRAQAQPIAVRRVPIDATGIQNELPGFDGFEAISFAGRDVYLSVETRPDPDHTVGFIVRGRVEGALERVVIDVSQRVRLEAQTDLLNTGYEAMVVGDDRVYAIYEANGDVNPHPRVLVFDRALAPIAEVPFGPVEYRVTDATPLDAQRRFWVANYHWPGSPWQPGVCQLTTRYGRGASHARCATVERLVELAVTDGSIMPTERAPILLELVDDEHARNWEGIVRLDDRGFLLATDEHPESILAFVPLP
jgi:hypothetical protein